VGEECITDVKKTNTFRVLVVIHKGKRPPGKCTLPCECNIKKMLKEQREVIWTVFF
jgi:hypothetical protein